MIEEMLKGTLAETLATAEEKESLRELFAKICEYITTTMPDEKVKRNFSKSLINSEDYISLQKEIESMDYSEIEEDNLLEFILSMIMKYGSTSYFKKFETLKQIVELAKLWRSGNSYNIIKELSFLFDLKIMKRGRYVLLTVEDVISICAAFDTILIAIHNFFQCVLCHLCHLLVTQTYHRRWRKSRRNY